MQNKQIQVEFSVSSAREGFEVDNVNTERGWSPKLDDTKPYLEVSFDVQVKLTSILTKMYKSDQTIGSFYLQYLPVDSSEFTFVMNEDGLPNSFVGISASLSDSVENPLSIVTSKVRVLPVRENIEDLKILSLEFMGCFDKSLETTPVIEETTKEIATTTRGEIMTESTSEPSIILTTSVVETVVTERSTTSPVIETSTTTPIVTTTTKITETTTKKLQSTTFETGKQFFNSTN